MADEPNLKAYHGDEPYVFVCYSHMDEARVYPEMEWLAQQGVHLWYDEGLSAGRQWRAEIAEALENASKVLFYISPHSLGSPHCNREINYAIDRSATIVPVYLEKVELTPDLRVGINRLQALFRTKDLSHRKQLLQALIRTHSVIESDLRHTEFWLGEWRVNPTQRTLTKLQDVRELQPKTMALLIFLAEHAGRTVTNDQIMRGVWGDVVITDDSIYQHIRRLRQQLQDDPKKPTYIQTVPRKGYRLLQPITIAEDSRTKHEHNERQKTTNTGTIAITSALLVLLLVAFGNWFTDNSLTREFTKPGEEHPIEFALHPQYNHRFAVLPFDNQTNESRFDQYGTDLSQAISHHLVTECCWSHAGVGAVPPAITKQYVGVDIRVVGEELDAAYVVSGTIKKIQDDLYRVTMTTDRWTDGEHFGSKRFDLPVGELQTNEQTLGHLLARSLLESLNGVISNVDLLDQTTNVKAIRLLKMGWGQHDAETRKAYFKQSIAEDPRFVRPYLALANWQHDPMEAETTIQSALSHGAGERDGTWQVAAEISMQLMDYQEADRRLEQCFQVRPMNWWCHNLKGRLEMRRGNLTAANDALRKSAVFWTEFFLAQGHGLRAVGEYTQALALYDKVIELDRFRMVYRLHAMVHRAELLFEMGNHAAASQQLDTTLKTFPNAFARTQSLYVMGKLGRVSQAQGHIDNLLTRQAQGAQVNPFVLVKAYLGVGKQQRAMDAIDIGLKTNPFDIAEFIRTPIYYGELRGNPRFESQLATLAQMENNGVTRD